MERSPHRLFVWDTETRTFPLGSGELLKHRVWAAETVLRHGKRPREPRVQATWGSDPEGLVDQLEAVARSDFTTWCFAHNQGFDLTVTRLPLRLLERGWVLTDHALGSESPWARLARGSRRLVLADSSSWLPTALQAIGVAVGIEKPALPAEDDDGDQWAWRCRQDVRILAQALVELLDWWDRRRLGSWSITGPQTGFNLMRHAPKVHQVVIDPDPEARAFERRAIMAGRREIWRLGRLPSGDYRELDFQRAHATVCAHLPLPKRRSRRFQSMDVDDERITSERWAPIAECVVRTTTPRYPVQYHDRLWYPVGSFRTVLCGPELAEARRRGELLEVGPGYVYQLGAHMAWWGRWVLDQLGEPDPDTPEVARTCIKAWSQRVPGKWAARSSRLLHGGQALELGWHLEHGRHHPSGAPCAVLDLAGRREVLVQDQDADDCFPAVLAWIQSEVRVRLGRLIDIITPRRMVSCNTDGVLYQADPPLGHPDLTLETGPLRVREKACYPWVDVISPQHVILPGERRLSGVPGNAEEVAPYQYRWLTWPRLPSQMESGRPDGYVRDARAVDLREVPVNRWTWQDGLTTPVTAVVGEDDVTRLVPVPEHLWRNSASELRRPQHPVLEQLLTPA